MAPRDHGQADKASDPAHDRRPTESVRRFPLLEPLQTERFTGLLGVRRPSHWTGRLETPTGVEALGDESFVKTWGPLPDERLTLSGTARLVRDKLPTFRTEPAPGSSGYAPASSSGSIRDAWMSCSTPRSPTWGDRSTRWR